MPFVALHSARMNFSESISPFAAFEMVPGCLQILDAISFCDENIFAFKAHSITLCTLIARSLFIIFIFLCYKIRGCLCWIVNMCKKKAFCYTHTCFFRIITVTLHRVSETNTKQPGGGKAATYVYRKCKVKGIEAIRQAFLVKVC